MHRFHAERHLKLRRSLPESSQLEIEIEISGNVESRGKETAKKVHKRQECSNIRHQTSTIRQFRQGS